MTLEMKASNRPHPSSVVNLWQYSTFLYNKIRYIGEECKNILYE